MPGKSGTFQFTCPKCQAVLRIPQSATKFKCPYHDDIFHVKAKNKDEQKKREMLSRPTNDMKPRRMSQRPQQNMNISEEERRLQLSKGVYSNFEQEILLLDQDNFLCDGFSHFNKCEYTAESEWMCFQCKKRLCSKHEEDIHQHPEYRSHVRISRVLFAATGNLFKFLDESDGKKDGKVPCSNLIKHTGQFILNAKEHVFVQDLLKANINRFGTDYCISFREFITELANHIHKVRKGYAHVNALGADVLDLNTDATKYQQLGTVGRFILDASNQYKMFKRRLEHFHLWSAMFMHIQSNYGGNIATYFIFSRWVFYLNLFSSLLLTATLFIPNLASADFKNYEHLGLIIGDGMEDSFMF